MEPSANARNNRTDNEMGGLRADPKAKTDDPASAEQLHEARVAVAEAAEKGGLWNRNTLNVSKRRRI